MVRTKLCQGYSYRLSVFSDGVFFGSLRRFTHDEPNDKRGEAGGGDPLLPPLPPLPQPGVLCPQLCLSGQQQIKKYERYSKS